MKNKTKKILITAGTILALMLTFTIGAYANELYQIWGGTESFENTSENHETLGEKIKGLFTQRDELQKDLTTITTERDGLVTEKETLTIEKQNLEDERDGLKADIVKIKGVNEAEENRLNQEIGRLNTTIGDLNNQIADLKNRINSLEQNITALDKRIKDKDSEIASLTEQGKTKDATITTLQVEKTTLTNQVSALEKELKDERELKATELAYAKKAVTDLITKVNGVNGKGPRYESLREDINVVAGVLGVEGRITDDAGQGPQDKQLKQVKAELDKAIKDVKQLEAETVELLKLFN